VNIEAVRIAPVTITLQVVRLTEVQIQIRVNLGDECPRVWNEFRRMICARKDASMSVGPSIDAMRFGDSPGPSVPFGVLVRFLPSPCLEVVALNMPPIHGVLPLRPLHDIAHGIQSLDPIANCSSKPCTAE